jgi:hypothetical protein
MIEPNKRYQVIIKGKTNLCVNNEWWGFFNTLEECNNWIDEESKLIGKRKDLYLSEEDSYINIADATDSKSIGGVMHYKHPDEATYQIVDRNADILATRYIELRKKEYPDMLECIEALLENMEGRPEKLQEVLNKRSAVKALYPKGE